MQRIISDFNPQGGKHCITNSLKQVFCYYKCPLSEAMIFGLGEGIDFTYINLANSPMVSGREKVLVFENTLANSLGISIHVKQNKDYTKVFSKTRQLIDTGHPVLVYVDMPYLDYFGMDENNHFGGHSVVIFGYDDENECFYVSERDHSTYPIRTPNGMLCEDYHLVSYNQMRKARSSNARPFPANNKYVVFEFSNYSDVRSDNLIQAIKSVCDKMLNPPAKLKGINGVDKFVKEVRKWKKFDSEKIKRAGITNYFQINEDGGTGGGIFRRMYGEFLIEAAELIPNFHLAKVGKEFIDLSFQWDGVAEVMSKLYETGEVDLLDHMSEMLKEICSSEMRLFSELKKHVN